MPTTLREQTVPPLRPSSVQSTKSFPSSPESSSGSTFSSDSVVVGSRTRSSSISSTSFSDAGEGHGRDFNNIFCFPDRDTNHVTAANSLDTNCAEMRKRSPVTDWPGSRNVALPRPQTVAGCPKRKASSAPIFLENAATNLVIRSKIDDPHSDIFAAEDQMLSGKKAQKKRGSAKLLKAGHTSKSVKAKRQLQRETARMAKSAHGFPGVLIDEKEASWSPSESTVVAHEEKESQPGHKQWAGARKPVPAAHNPNKRCATAPDLATSMLLRDLERTMGIAIQ